jgi:hypothetical protein
MTNQQIADAFIAQIKAGYIHPEHMADVLYAMHNAMVDRYDEVALWMPVNLDQTADQLVEAIRINERQLQDYPEEVQA